MESRTSPGPATLRHHDAVIATLRGAGFSHALTAHAYALLDSYTYGFALQEVGLPFEGSDTVAEVAEPIMERFSTGDYPHLTEMASDYYLRPGYDFGDEFDWGLDLILEGLTRSATRAKQIRVRSGSGAYPIRTATLLSRRGEDGTSPRVSRRGVAETEDGRS